MAEIVDISPKLEALFPIGEPPFVLELVPGATGRWIRSEEPTAVATIRTVLWEPKPEGGWQIRDIKEQELGLGWPALYDDGERIAAFFAALAALLPRIEFAKLESLMPVDVLPVDALKLRSARTQEDFEAALAAKGRLGKLLA